MYLAAILREVRLGPMFCGWISLYSDIKSVGRLSEWFLFEAVPDWAIAVKVGGIKGWEELLHEGQLLCRKHQGRSKDKLMSSNTLWVIWQSWIKLGVSFGSDRDELQQGDCPNLDSSYLC